MNVLWQVYEELFLGAEKSIFFHLNAPPKVTFPVYKARAVCKASDNVRRSLRKNVSLGQSTGAAKREQRCDSYRTRCPRSFIALHVKDILLGQCGHFLLICPCITRDLGFLPVQLRLFHLVSPSVVPRKPTAACGVERGVCKHVFTETAGKPASESSSPRAVCFNSSSSQAITSGSCQFLIKLGIKCSNTVCMYERGQDRGRRSAWGENALPL